MSKAVIDWTKPIEFVSSVWPDGIPAKFIGERDGLFYITTHNHYYANAYTADGHILNRPSGSLAHIRNVPPPKIEKTVVVLLFESGECFGIKKEYADHYTKNIVARKTITITEGEGM